jgi:chitin synthase
MGLYQDGVAKDTVNGKDVQAHIFEYTTSVTVTAQGEVAPSACPVQVIFCRESVSHSGILNSIQLLNIITILAVKEQNKKKLNSHRWFFNAFGPLIQPNGMCCQHFHLF